MRDMPKFGRRKVARNAGWLIGGNVVHKALAFLMSILVARYLGPGDYGLINYAGAYTAFFASLCTLGINSVIVKEFLDNPDEQGVALGTTFVLRGVSSLLSALAIVCIVLFVDADEPLTIAVVALCSVGLVFQVYDSMKCWFQARLQSKYCAIAVNISYLAVCAFQVALLALGKDVRWFALASSVDYIVAACFLFAVYRRMGGQRLSFSWEKGLAILRLSVPFILAGLMVAVYASTDRLMLKQMLDDTAVGFYSLACSLSTAWTFVLSSIIDSVYPAIVQAFQRDRAVYNKLNRQLYAVVFYVSCGMSLVVMLVAEPLVRLLYGDSYLPAVAPLRVVVWYTAFSYLGVARNPWMVCEGCQGYLKYLYAAAAALNVVMNLALIPLWGATGAAAASLATQMATTLVLPALIGPLRPNARLMLDAILLRGVFPVRDSER